MPQKRMFSLSVVDTDRFLEMPVSAQALYFHLGMHGDDDGFVSSPRKIARAAGCNMDDLRILAQKNFIIPFESGVIVIVEWNINNTLKNDRYSPTKYQTEKALLTTTPGGAYAKNPVIGMQTDSSLEPEWNQSGTIPEPQLNVTKHNITEHSESMATKRARSPEKRKKRFVPPTVEEVQAYCRERNNNIDPQRFIDYYTANGWTQGHGKPIKDWRAAMRTWEGRTLRPIQKSAPTHPAPAVEDYDFSGYLGGETP